MTAGELSDAIATRRRLVRDLLVERGAITDPAWERCYDAVPRHAFIPDVVWMIDSDDGEYVRVDRAEHEDWWVYACYCNDPVITQVDAAGFPTSSCSMPSVVFWVLDELDVRDGQRVLEIGTGTGYNAALLAARLGERNVTSVEVDPAVAASARSALDAAGFRPLVVTADGAAGYPDRAPYDRVIATCAIQDLPRQWMAQTAPGGVILTPWRPPLATGGQLLRLTVGHGGTASGPFIGSAWFMCLRAQTPARGAIHDLLHHDGEDQKSTTRLDPREVFSADDSDDDRDNEAVEFVTGLLVGDCVYRIGRDDAAPDEHTVWLFDSDGGSWAAVIYQPGVSVFPVYQYGPRRLWDEVEVAYRRWVTWGRPEPERFGLTVTPEGQHVWLDAPGRTVTPAA